MSEENTNLASVELPRITRKKTIETYEEIQVSIPSYWQYGPHETYLYKLDSDKTCICIRDHEGEEYIEFTRNSLLLNYISSGKVTAITEERFNRAVEIVKTKISEL